MFPAARLGDTTAHGGVIVVGFPTVLIGNRPAARIGDMHACPMVTGVVPHVGGPLVMGAFTVLVGGMPQSRVSDTLVCVGPPDVVVAGENTVLVGMVGAGGFMSALRGLAMAGAALLGRLAGGGYPRVVLNPDGTTQTEYNSSITIRGSPQYQATVVSDLDRLAAPLADGSPSTGGRLLDSLQESGRHVTIQPVPAGDDQGNAFATRHSSDGLLQADGTPGAGCDSTVSYNPSLTMDYTGEDGNTYTLPPQDILAHELGHSDHNARGENRRNLVDPMDPSDNQEEARNIGVHGYEGESISERGLSTEAGRSPRPNHDAVTGMDYQDENGAWHHGGYDAAGNWQDNTVPAPPGTGRPNH
jgi:uncharacterized Zn-binding protein involved in type VI secretion